jgi:hypothetical protein
MGFSLETLAFLRAGLPEEPWRRLFCSPGYSVGFVLAILGRQQLFTESTLMAVLPLMVRRDSETLIAVLRVLDYRPYGEPRRHNRFRVVDFARASFQRRRPKCNGPKWAGNSRRSVCLQDA